VNGQEKAVRSFVLIVATIVVSALIFIVFGFLGFCTMTRFLGQSGQSMDAGLLGAAFVIAGSMPLISSLTILIAYLRKKRLGSIATSLIWSVIVIVAACGAFQMLMDPADAIWAGLPLWIASALLASSMLSFRDQ
jgi:hypothetical protein